MRAALCVLVMYANTGALSAEDFTGKWEVTQVLNERDGFPWSREIDYPKTMTFELRDGVLVGSYVNQGDRPSRFCLLTVLNGGKDLLLAGCGETKSPEARMPIHHVKLREAKLHAVVTTHDKVFEWVAVRRK